MNFMSVHVIKLLFHKPQSIMKTIDPQYWGRHSELLTLTYNLWF